MACRRQNLGHVDYKSRSCIRHLGRVDYKSGSCRVRIGVYVDYSLTWVAQTTTVDRHVLCRLQIWHTPSIAFQHSSLEEGCCKPVLGVCKYGSQTGNMSCKLPTVCHASRTVGHVHYKCGSCSEYNVTIQYKFIAKCHYRCTKNALWCQVHPSLSCQS